jgi:hypothetical protein
MNVASTLVAVVWAVALKVDVPLSALNAAFGFFKMSL